MAGFLKSIFGTGDENEGFMDYEDAGYDTSSSAVTNEEADYSSAYSGMSGSYGSGASKVINMHSASGSPKIFVMRPSGYEEVMNTAVDMLREGTIMFLNLNNVDQEIGTRIVDFMTGVAAAFEGRIKKVDTCTYAIAPKNVEWVNNIDE